VIAFGTIINEPEAYRLYTEPGIRRAAEPDSVVLPFAAVSTITRSYNIVLDAAAVYDLEALVLLHPHTELADPDLCARVRAILSDPDVAIAGAAGGSGAPGIGWWDGRVSAAPGTHHYAVHGGGELPAFGWAYPVAPLGPVDAVDGALLVFSPWAVRNLRFDEALRVGYGYDTDLCRQARAAGRKVVTADLRAVFHHELDLVEDIDLWIEGHQQLAEKWDPGEPDDAAWKVRARRAEAEREAARAITEGRRLAADAQLEELERRMREATETLSWRVTAPLRRLNHRRRRLRALIAKGAPDVVLGDRRMRARDAQADAQTGQPAGD
jgi:hypothetical protein